MVLYMVTAAEPSDYERVSIVIMVHLDFDGAALFTRPTCESTVAQSGSRESPRPLLWPGNFRLILAPLQEVHTLTLRAVALLRPVFLPATPRAFIPAHDSGLCDWLPPLSGAVQILQAWSVLSVLCDP